MPTFNYQTDAVVGDRPDPTRYRTRERIEVFGLERPLDCPEGTELTHMGYDLYEPGVVLVMDATERTVKIPAKLLERISVTH